MTRFYSLVMRRPIAREFLIFAAFLLLTVVMTWPWITHLRDAASDPGDPYFSSWVLWWDYHQTFHDPLNLFHANIFYPYRYSLAFSEHDYGIALLFFPLFALGLRPLTVHGVATLFGFAFSGYGALRLARRLTDSTGVAWVAGITFAFIPYRFGQLPHLIYLFAGWIPILLEALVLFARERTTKYAVWLGVAFFMNGLTCVHWFLLTLIPLAFSGVFLLVRYRAWRDPALWRKGAVALAVAAIGLVPFLIPYSRAAALYGFVRNPAETLFYSATPLDWLVGEYRSKTWSRLNSTLRGPEKALFPGLLPPLLMLSAVFLVQPSRTVARLTKTRTVVVVLDAAAIICGVLLITITGFGYYKLRVFGYYLLEIRSAGAVAITLVLILLTRILIAYPEVIKRFHERGIIAAFRANRRSDAFWLGMIWAAVGFFGSLGMNFYFHRFLYEYVPIFRSIRVPARWSMMAYLGLSLLAGLGAKEISSLLTRHWSRVRPVAVYVLIGIAILIEQRVAPLDLIHGAADPDAVTLRLKQTPMSGGVVELPTTIGKEENYLYTLRAADHARPLITAVSGFSPPLQLEIQALTHDEVIPDKFMDLLESIPCSYLVIHNNFLTPSDQLALESFLARTITSGRLRFIKSFDAADLYAVTRTEPNAKSEGIPAFSLVSPGAATSKADVSANDRESQNPIDDAKFFVRAQYLDLFEREPDASGWDYWTAEIQRCGNDATCLEDQRVKVAAAFLAEREFQETGFFLYCLYHGTLGRPPSYNEFKSDRAKVIGGPNLETRKSAFLEEWITRSRFMSAYSSKLEADQFVDVLLKSLNAVSGVSLNTQRQSLIDQLKTNGNRAGVVRRAIEDEAFTDSEHDRAFVLMQYFGFLKRDADAAGYNFWLNALSKRKPETYQSMVRAFITSKEYRSRFVRP